MVNIKDREKWLDSHFFIKTEIVKSLNGMNIERRKYFVGLSSENGEVILPTFFDDLIFVDPNMLCAYINERYGFYNVLTNKWIIEPSCESYLMNDFYKSIEIIQNGKHGLIDIDDQCLLINPCYEKVSANSKCNYIWVEQNGLYHYIKRSTGEKLSMPGAIDAFDTNFEEEVVFIKKRNGMVECMNEKGYLAIAEFRHIMKRHAGRLKLYNSQKHNFVIIDIYGRILN